MKLTRREILKQTAKLGTTAIGMGAAAFVAQRLLEQNSDEYPVLAENPYATDTSQRLIRPPGALENDTDFLAACIRCYRCQDACEPGAIQFFAESAGEYYHTPYIDPAIKACEPCMKCTQVCPTTSLSPMTMEEKRDVRMASVELREDLCLSHKAKRLRDEQALLMKLGRDPTESVAPTERRGPCGECYMFCPVREHAIKLEPGQFLAPRIYPDECIGCGMCEEICRMVVRGEPAIKVVPIRKMT